MSLPLVAFVSPESFDRFKSGAPISIGIATSRLIEVGDPCDVRIVDGPHWEKLRGRVRHVDPDGDGGRSVEVVFTGDRA